jgi:hypothetical protein
MTSTLLRAAAALEASLLAPDLPERDLGEGRAYVAGLTRWACERALVASDPDRPRFARCMDTVSKWGLDNPDNIYRSARIQGDAEYVISGDRGNCADLAIEVLTGLAGDDGGTGEGISCIDSGALEVEADGTYRVYIGGKPRASNHLATGPTATEVFVRHTLGDWGESAGSITIERLTPVARAAPDTADLLERGAGLLAAQAGFLERFAAGWRQSVPLNDVTPPSGGKGGGFLPGQRNAVGQYALGDAEALVISIDPVECRYMSVGIGHHRWFVSFDYRNRHCHINSAQALLSSDGRQHVVLSAADPGVPNWVDTAGHGRGFMFLRWQGVAGGDPSAPDIAVVPTDAVRDRLPPGEPVVDAALRAATIAGRSRAVDRRFFGR